jgi:putative flippase GtrA
VTKKDLQYSIMSGLLTGVLAWRVFDYLETSLPLGISLFVLVFLIPACWIAGVWFGYFLARWMPFFAQFGKFAAIGFTNAAVDFGVLYLLIGMSGIATGVYYTVFKSTSFLVAMLNSYLWNKFWTFSGTAQSGQNNGSEFLRFAIVTLIGFLINVGIATLMVNVVGSQFGMDEKAWAGMGAVAGSALGLIWNFVGMRLLVFASKKQ